MTNEIKMPETSGELVELLNKYPASTKIGVYISDIVDSGAVDEAPDVLKARRMSGMSMEMVKIMPPCIKCAKCQFVGRAGHAYCDKYRLPQRALYSKKNSCQSFVPRDKEENKHG